MSFYHEQFTWSHVIDDRVIAHSDGAVSLMIGWSGVDCSLMTDQETANIFAGYYRLLHQMDDGYCYEFHFWRERDAVLASNYIAKNNDMVRSQDFVQPMKVDMANHLSQYALANSVALVITKKASTSLFGLRAALKKQTVAAQALLDHAAPLLRYFTDSSICDADTFAKRVQQSCFRPGHVAGNDPVIDPRFGLAEQWVREKPSLIENDLLIGDSIYSHTLLLFLYPDASAGWFTYLASMGITFHVSHIVMPVDTKAAMRKSESDSDIIDSTVSSRGQEYAAGGLSALAGFRQFVADNNLRIFNNSYIVHLHGTKEQLQHYVPLFSDYIDGAGGQVRDADYIQLPYYRVGQPGQGYRSPLLRPDHTLQVANMLPVQVFDQGERHPQSLRLGNGGQLVGFSYSKNNVSHAFTVAKTRSGKGVDKVATIIETYPYGIDWYILEIGESYRWAVEALGGKYNKIDPNTSVINPFPPYSMASTDASLPLNATIAGSAVQSLSFLLTDGETKLTVHQMSAAQQALQLMYAMPCTDKEAPTLDVLLDELHQLDVDSQPVMSAAKEMANNIDSLLNTTEGRLFTTQSNVSFSSGITGVDLRDVDKASPKLLQFYLVFVSLQYSYLAFANRRPARILLDEIHKFVRVAPDVVGRLISEVARMGGKEAGSIDLVTQGIMEIDHIESEVLNSMVYRSLLYREDEHDDIASRIGMPTGALNVWRNYAYPLDLPYRPGMRSAGDQWFDLHLTFPESVLAVADTRPTILDAKDRIAAELTDPLERVRALTAFIRGTNNA